jgi:hypothetical protein
VLVGQLRGVEEDTQGSLAATTATRYTIDTPPIDSKLLQATVYKNMKNLNRYLQSRPIANHTIDAFTQLQVELQKMQCPTSSTRTKDTPTPVPNPHHQSTAPLPILYTDGYILDSGCGTGRSSLVLGHLFPNSIIIGIDRSLDRLSRTATDLLDDAVEEDEEEDVESSWVTLDKNNDEEQCRDGTTTKVHVQRVKDNGKTTRL